VAPGDPTRGSGSGPQRRSVMGGSGSPFGPTGASRPASGAAPGARRAAPSSSARPAPAARAGAASGGRRAAGSTGSASRGATGAGSRARAAGGSPGGRGGRRRLIDYPREGRTGFRRWIPSWRLVTGTFLFLVALAVGAFIYAYATTEIPPASAFAGFQTTTVYYADGRSVMGEFAEQNRHIVGSDEIPDHVKKAVVAAEDRTFYENPGINPAGILRALYLNVTGKDQQGGSSITQQYAERYYIGQTTTDIPGKIREAFLAVKLARVEDKDAILVNYLNTIYFGRDAYGIEAAAREYFGVSASELTVSQGAMLAGLIPSPNNFDPAVSIEQAQRRWNYVLDGMVTTGALTQAERDAQEFPEFRERTRSDTYGGPNGYILDMVRREIVANAGITEEELDTRGFRIVTTIEKPLQEMALRAVATLPPDHSPNLRTALVTLSPTDGAILALYGGPDFLTQARNAVTQDIAQAGSTFKPFTLVAYLENGGSLKSRYSGRSGLMVEGFGEGGARGPVRNFGNQSYGELTVPEATAASVNAVYAQMNVEVGPERTLDVAQRAGVCASWAREAEDCSLLDNQAVPSNVLGTASPHPLDMAEAYNTFAAQGVHHQPFLVRTVQYVDTGDVAYDVGDTTGERVFAADVMADTTFALRQPIESPRGTARKAREVGHPVAGKTGTSNENRSAWFIGYTGHMTTAVALYQVGQDEDGRAVQETITPFGGVSQVTGGSIPLDVWTAFMVPAHADREVIPFPEPADVGEPNTPPLVEVPSVTGLPEAEARATLEALGFVVAVVPQASDTVPVGIVVSQDPSGGEAEQGSTVTIVVSTGPGQAEVPDVVGRSEADARAALTSAGFAVAVEQRPDAAPAGQVIDQSPRGGQADRGATVTIVVSTGPPDDGGGGDDDGGGGDDDGGGGDDEGGDGG